MKKNQKTTVTAEMKQQSFDAQKKCEQSGLSLSADHIISGNVLIRFK